MKRAFFFFILLTILSTQLNAQLYLMIQKKLLLIHQLSEHNITESHVDKITQDQQTVFKEALEKFFHHKKQFLKQSIPYQEEILLLENKIMHNKSKNNNYAVLRDEVLIKTYQIFQEQDKLLKHIFRALDLYDFEGFSADMNKRFIENQQTLEKINTVDYKPFLGLKEKNAILQEAQKNIKDYYALIEINSDILKYYSIFEKRMYRLNKYANYHILTLALYLDHSMIGKQVNSLLYPYNLSIVKLFLILIISLSFHILRKQFNKIIEIVLGRIKYLKNNSEKIIYDLNPSLNVLFVIINLHIIVHIYYNFSTDEQFTKFFNIIYSLLFSFMLYRIINTVAEIIIHDIEQSDVKIKSEMVNVGLKIINFIILIIGILLVMHFAGANLTAVLSGLGIGGLAIAFAAKETLANFFGTISILASDMYSQGDKILVDDKQGSVVEIGLRVTTLRTFENALISIPNGVIANKDVINWSRRKIGRLIKMSIGLKYDSEAENIRNAIEEIRQMLKNHPNIATHETNYEIDNYHHSKLVSKEDSHGIKRILLVYLDELADSSINICIHCFTIDTAWEKWLQTKEDVIFEVMAILKKNHLEFAYPSMSLYHENKE